MRHCSTTFLSLIALVWGVATPSAHAWGPDGHRIVAELSERRLEGPARRQIEQLLALDGTQSLADIANWADEVRDHDAYRWGRPYHYLNFPRGICHYVAERDCKDGACVVGGIIRFSADLSNLELPLSERREALNWLVHFVGDLHQPMHAGYGDDRGGNDFQINYLGRGSNLHAAWDSLLINSRELPWREYSEELDARASSSPAPQQAIAAIDWAEESCRIIEEAEIYPPRPGRLNRAYVERQRPVAETRLISAGERLAGLLNGLLLNSE